MTGRKSNILDPIHDTLPPDVWDDPGSPTPTLKPVHRRWIISEIHRHAKTFHPHPEQWLQLVLTGSLTTYQYSAASDCDVSLFVDPHFLPEWDRARLIALMIEHVDGTTLPGTPYQMQGFVVAKNIGMADLYQPGLRSGYDIIQQNWIQPPDKSRVHDVEREYNTDYVYALESADKMERLLRYEPDKAVKFWHQIHQRRMRDQKAGKGDFSQANIVYKFLANRELFPRISEVSGEYIARRAGMDPHDRNIFHPEPEVYQNPWRPGKFGKGIIYMKPNGQPTTPEGSVPSDFALHHWQTDEHGWPHHIGLNGPELRHVNNNSIANIYIAPDGRASVIENWKVKDPSQYHEFLQSQGLTPIHGGKYNPFDPMTAMPDSEWADLWDEDD